MMRNIFFLSLFLIAQLVTSAQTISRADYIETYSSIAVEEMKRTGIPASITLAQGILESANGNSRLAQKANNHFGIKCHNSWTGATIKHHDDKRNECFRKYRNADESFRDHSQFLQEGSRYSALFLIDRTDYKSWARGLQKAGYATNRQYANKLIDLIERHELYVYDKGAVSVKEKPVVAKSGLSEGGEVRVGSSKHEVKEQNRVSYVVAQQGDTYESLTEAFDKMRWELRKYNDAPDGVDPTPGQIVYLQPKRNRADRGQKKHTVAPGETMWHISQKYAVRLSKLYKKNRMELGDEPSEDDTIWLRRRKPKN
ncbi:MAG: glucosaminidase domain-containing protein [Salinivirgaceae bacterium]|nr:glucosaminidase domain-containing protein [Salinivirgaceae bacterium]